MAYVVPPLILVDCATQVIESIWPTPPPTAVAVKLLPLRLFVQEVLRRSRTSYVTLQTALFYLTRVHGSPWARHMTDENCASILDSVMDATCINASALATAMSTASSSIPAACVPATSMSTSSDDSSEGMATPPDSQRGSSPALTSAELDSSSRYAMGASAASAIEARLAAGTASDASSTSSSSSSPLTSSDPRQCGRRMFLASLVIATKYLQDRAYSNRAWSRVSGLSASEITRCERKLLHWLSWNLYIPEKDFSEFQADLLARVDAAGATAAPAPATIAPKAMPMVTKSLPPATPMTPAFAARTYSTPMPVSKEVLLQAFTAGRSVSLPMPKVSPTPPSPCTPGIVIGRVQHGFASPTPSPHPCAAASVAAQQPASHLQRKRPRPDNDICEQMLRDILAQRPRTAAMATNVATTAVTRPTTIG